VARSCIFQLWHVQVATSNRAISATRRGEVDLGKTKSDWALIVISRACLRFMLSPGGLGSLSRGF
jgi:hypothetical protein